MREFSNIEDRLDFLEYRQQLLYNNDDVSHIFFEYEVSREESKAIMDLMDKYSDMIRNNQVVHSADFEHEVYSIVPSINSDYHFCESIAKAFYEQSQWVEVFPALYANNPKYRHLFEER